MFQILIFYLLISKSFAQFDGQFWWLNSKLDKFREPPAQPKFEDLSESETDQSAKIVFRDDDLLPNEQKFPYSKISQENLVGAGKFQQAIKFEDKSEIALLKYTQEPKIETETTTEKKVSNNGRAVINSDIFELKFPDETLLTPEKFIINKTIKIGSEINDINTYKNDTSPGKITYLINTVPFKVHKNGPSEAENICTYMKKTECSRIGGVIYIKHKSDGNRHILEARLICCILPIRSGLESSKIYFAERSKPKKRCKRSDKEINTAMKQRNALLLRKFGSQTHKLIITTPNPTKVSHRVVTPSDEYVDPYWNIKNSNIKKPNKQTSSSQNYEYDEDYIEDYTVEIPKPGLTGLYSDHGPSKPGWVFPTRPNYGEIDNDEVDDEPNLGYLPTVDPRIEDRQSTSIPRVSGRPVKLSTYVNEKNYDAESQTISYHANPDFKVLQGFKLLSLVRNRSKVHRNKKNTVTERFYDSGSKEHVLTSSLDSDYGEENVDNTQVYKECGRIAMESNRNNENGKNMGDTARGSHPALALVVLTKRRKSFLCYATLVHPRAAVTAANCVFGRNSPGEITVIVGAWRLNEETREEWQKRMATIHIHSLFRPGELAHNLALLYWKRPLRFSENVQPACLSDPHVGDDCKFFGWGGYDQAIRKQSRWQRALVLAPSTCEERVTNKYLPAEAYCASVLARGSVTGLGGPLMCTISGRQSMVGLAVWRDLAVVLIPAHEWVLSTIDNLQLD